MKPTIPTDEAMRAMFSEPSNPCPRQAGTWRRTLRRFGRDERGTSLTEFVIVLPVFLIIFSGLMTMGELQRQSVGVKIRATKQVWKKAIDAQRTVYDVTHVMPPIAAGAGMANVGLSSIPDGMAQFKKVGLMANGHHGESRNAIMSNVGLINNIGPAGSPYGATSDYISEPLAYNMIDDSPSSLVNPLTYRSPFEAFAPAVPFSFTGPRPTMAAGIRYGMVRGEDVTTVNLGALGSTDLKAKYDVLVAPQAQPGIYEMVEVGFSRLGAEERSEIADLLEVDCSIVHVGRPGADTPAGLALVLVLAGMWRVQRRRREQRMEVEQHGKGA